MNKFQLAISVIFIFGSINAIKADEIPFENKDTIVLSYTADEVVIQAFKQNDNLATTPIAATLISAQTIKDRNITDINEISSFVPNLFIPDYGSKMTSPAYIRGIGSRINAPSVGLYVDGIPYLDRSTFDFNLNDIERIEVLRGPQGTIYGRNTMGGIVNVYTKSPFKYKETNVGVSAGNYNNYSVRGSHFGSIKNTFGYSVSANYLHKGGYFDNITKGKKADPMDAISTRVRLSWKLSPQWSAHLTSAFEYSDQDGYPYSLYNEATNHLSAINYNADSYFKRNMSTTGLNVEYETSKLRFSSQSSFQYFDGQQGLDQDFTPKDMYYVDFNQRQRMYSQEFNLKSKNIKEHEWLFGAFGFYQDYGTSNFIDYRSEMKPPSLLSEVYQDISTPTLGAAVFYQSTLNNVIIPNLSVTAGFRYDWEQIKADVLIRNIDTAGVVNTPKDQEDKVIYSAFTPKFALKYTFTNDEIIYASVTNGYKSGGFNNTMLVDEHLSFKPESSWSYEVGAKASCLNKLIYTDISFFFIDWTDQQISQYQSNGGYILKNAGKSTSKGFEITIHANPLEALSLQLSYGYTKAKFKEYLYNSRNNTDYSGNYLPMVPRNTLSAGAKYSIVMKDKTLVDKIVLNTQYTGQGKIFWREDNVGTQKFYGILNAGASFVKKNISLDLWAKNITNQDYAAYYFKSQTGNFAQRGKPFTFGVDVNVKF